MVDFPVLADPLRLAVLNAYRGLIPPAGAALDTLARLAAQVCGAPTGLITLVDDARQVFQARQGYEGAAEAPLDTGFCPFVVQAGEPVVVPDTRADPTHADNPATREAGVRFYAGVPLLTPDKQVLGTLCVLDTTPRPGGLSPDQLGALRDLAAQVVSQFELRRLLAGQEALLKEQQAVIRERNALAAAGHRMRSIFDSATEVALVVTDAQGRVTDWNLGAERILGWPAEAMWGQTAERLFTPEDRAAGQMEKEMRSALEQGRAADERWHLRQDGSRFWASGEMTPLRSESGEALGFVKALRDRTEEHLAAEALKASERALRLERNTLEAIFEAAPVGLSLSEAPSGASILLNPEMHRILGGRDISGPDVSRYERASACTLDGAPLAVEQYPTVRALNRGETVRAELILFQQAGGGRLRAEVSSAPIHDLEGRVIASITAAVDVERREQALEQQQLLAGELAHRMKNTLSIVQAIVSQTLRSSASLHDARTEVMARLAVLGRAQDALTRKSWLAASLADTVAAALEPLALPMDRLSVEGPEVAIGSRAALSFTLALHELGTNAIKYGALSSATGRIDVRWTADEGRVVFVWDERDGPAVRPPERKGFGSRLIESVSRTFDGESTLSYNPSGVCWRLTAGLKALQAF